MDWRIGVIGQHRMRLCRVVSRASFLGDERVTQIGQAESAAGVTLAAYLDQVLSAAGGHCMN
jgi:hypothetical protein